METVRSPPNAARGGEVVAPALAEAGGAGPAGFLIAAAGLGGADIGKGIERATDGAPSDFLSEALHDLVGEEESYEAAEEFADGDVLGGGWAIASGVVDTAADAASDVWDAVTDW